MTVIAERGKRRMMITANEKLELRVPEETGYAKTMVVKWKGETKMLMAEGIGKRITATNKGIGTGKMTMIQIAYKRRTVMAKEIRTMMIEQDGERKVGMERSGESGDQTRLRE
jgi:hypothetical protein